MNRILLIDDEEGIRVTFKRLHDAAEPIFRGRLEMDVASTIGDAEKKIGTTKYDALILDLKFEGSGMDETIGWVFENASRTPPIIVLTGDEDVYVRGRCMIAGAASFWLKMDAAAHPDLFFKEVYNQYLKRYDARTHRTPP